MKRGSVLDLLLGSIILLVIGMGLYISWYTADVISDDAPQINSTYMDLGKGGIENINNTFPFIAIGLGLGAVILVFTLRSSPILFVFSIILLGFVMIVNAQLSNVWGMFVTQFPTEVLIALPFVGLINVALPIYAMAFGIPVIILMHSRMGGEQVL